jgi:uncharacterized protein
VTLLLEALVGLVAGLVGGLLGLGGSVIIIPALIFYFSHTGRYTGSAQHLIQAAAMICNIFIAAPSSFAHARAGAMVPPVLRVLAPTALLGMMAGVALSNSPWFARENGAYLAMLLAAFLLIDAAYNVVRAVGHRDLAAEFDECGEFPAWKTALCGVPVGLVAGLLGVGGGVVCVAAQQLFLRIPLRRAIANSAMTIFFTATFGAIYKNATLAQHGETIADALRLAAAIVPTAILGGYLGGRLAHAIPRRTLRIVFIVFMLLLAYVTFSRACRTLQTDDGGMTNVESQMTKEARSTNERRYVRHVCYSGFDIRHSFVT